MGQWGHLDDFPRLNKDILCIYIVLVRLIVTHYIKNETTYDY